MAYTEQINVLEAWACQARRVLINGPPFSGKTTSLRTWPKPLVIIVAPSEKGTTSLPAGEGIKSFVRKTVYEENPNWTGVLAEFNKQLHEVLTGKHGPVQTLAIDGIHKLYALFLNVVTNGAKARGELFEGRQKYPQAGALFSACLDRILMALNIPNVVMTCWDGLEKDDPDEKGDTNNPPSRHIFPNLPGQAAKDIMGEFPVVLYSLRQGAGPAAKYVWQTQPLGKVWGAGVKMPLEIAAKLPITVPQDWAVLERLLMPQEVKGAR